VDAERYEVVYDSRIDSRHANSSIPEVTSAIQDLGEIGREWIPNKRVSSPFALTVK